MERPVDSAVDRSPIIDRVTPRLSLSTYSGNRNRLGVKAGGASLPPGGRSNRSSGITGPASQAAALPAVKWRAAPPPPARRGSHPTPDRGGTTLPKPAVAVATRRGCRQEEMLLARGA